MIVYHEDQLENTIRLDPELRPIAIVLSDKDKENIANMARDADTYCVYPDTMSQEDISVWLKFVKTLEQGYTP